MPLPDTLPELAIAGYQLTGNSRCECGRKIFWFRTPNNRQMPFSLKEDVMVSEVSVYVMPSATKYTPHFSDCPLVNKFRKNRRS